MRTGKHSPNRQNSDQWLIVPAFLAIYVVWGASYLANLFALRDFRPFVLSCLRYLTAGVLLAAWARIRGYAWPERRSFGALSVSGILMLVGGSGLVAYAEQYINSGYAAVLVATEPLWFVLLDRGSWKLYFSNAKVWTGLLLGFAGIALFAHFSPETNAGADNMHKLQGTLILLLSAVSWVVGTLYARKRVTPCPGSNVAKTSVQLIVAGLFSGVLALIRGEWAQWSPGATTLPAWGGLLFLIVMGSLVAYLAFTWLVTVQPPAIVSTHTYVNPIIAIFIGWLIAREQICMKQVFGLVIVLIGVLLTQIGRRGLIEE